MNTDRYVVALGMFDGVHLGHCALISSAVFHAREQGRKSVVFTFENHPMELFKGRFEYLNTNEQRVERIKALECDVIDMVPFTKSMAETEPEDFIKGLLARYDNRVDDIFVGFNYSFGQGGRGTPELLRELGKELGFGVTVIDPIMYKDEPISSSRIRAAIKAGDMQEAKRMLWTPYTLCGKVIANRGIGRRIGYPTANIDCEKQVMPQDGVYATAALIDGQRYCAVTNVGRNPTFDGTNRSVETHIIGFHRDLYERELRVEMLEKLRDDIKFESVNELKTQIGADIEQTKKIFENGQKKVYNR
ncbi:MAG TPA: bifunctional riboflavin kinase/FAD synthetase [Clostridia bacterium]|nr:bifunctional riboflavin kinase/FAD synthetase [Clostridia bacterium]